MVIATIVIIAVFATALIIITLYHDKNPDK